jgi:hypothetical protein
MTPAGKPSLGVAAAISADYCQSMDEPEPNRRDLIRTRVFLVVFFGVAMLFALMTVWATWTAGS